MFNLFKRAESTQAKPRRRFMPRGLVRSLLGQARADRLSGDLPTVPVPADDFIAKYVRTHKCISVLTMCLHCSHP